MTSETGRQRTLDKLLKHPLINKNLRTGSNKGVLKHQLQDPSIADVNYDEIQQVGLKDYLRQLLEQGSVWEEQRQKKEEVSKTIAGLFSGSKIDEVDSRITIIINDEYTELKVILHRPEPGQGSLTDKDIWKMLLQRGITKGIKEEFIIRLVENPIYEKRFKIAWGKKPGAGKDGKVLFSFDTTFSPIPKIKKDGTVDYKELNYTQSVKKGTLLGRIEQPERGEDGYTLDGRILQGKMGKPAKIRIGSNTTLSSDKTKIYASSGGSPILRGYTIEVSKTLSVDMVDNTTGNVTFDGSIYIKGDVSAGFTVCASGDIVSEGIVEGELYAGGNVSLKKGIKGNRAKIEADGDIYAEFIENTNIIGKKSVVVDVLLNTQLECWDRLDVTGERGKLIGGKSKVGGGISANYIGNEANTVTVLKLASSEGEEEHKKLLEEKVVQAGKMTKTIEGLIPRNVADDDISGQIIVFRLVLVIYCLDAQVEEWNQEIDNIIKKHASLRKVCARRKMYPNVSVEIQGMYFHNSTQKDNGAIIKVLDGKMVSE